jgi:integrase
VIRTYEVWIDSRLRPALGTRKLVDLHRDDVQDFAEELIAEGLDASTVRSILMPLRVIYRRAIQRGEVSVNPTAYLELPALEGTRNHVADPKLATELIAADSKAGVIHVERSMDSVEGEIDPKSKAGKRVVPLCDHLRVYLAPHIARLGRKTGLVFGDTATVPYDYGKTTRRAYSAFKKAKLERFTLHELRHSLRSYLDAIPTISDTRVDRYMGHSDNSMRARYTHSLDGQLALDAAALDEYLDGMTNGKIVPLAVAGAAS